MRMNKRHRFSSNHIQALLLQVDSNSHYERKDSFLRLSALIQAVPPNFSLRISDPIDPHNKILNEALSLRVNLRSFKFEIGRCLNTEETTSLLRANKHSLVSLEVESVILKANTITIILLPYFWMF